MVHRSPSGIRADSGMESWEAALEETILFVSRDAAERRRLAGIGRQMGLKSWATSSRIS